MLLYLLHESSGILHLNGLFYLSSTKSIFRPTFRHWISTFYRSLESLEQKEADYTTFAKKFCIVFFLHRCQEYLHIFRFPWMEFICIDAKRICTFSVFLDYKFSFRKLCKYFFIFEFAVVRAFLKCIIYHISRTFCFLQFFLLNNLKLQLIFDIL